MPEGNPIWYLVDQGHPYYDEALQFCVSTISMQSLLVAQAFNGALEEGNVKVEVALPGQDQVVHAVEVPNINWEMHYIHIDTGLELIIHSANIVDYLFGRTEQPEALFFVLRPFNVELPSENQIKGKIDHHVEPSLNTLSTYLIGGAFERYKDNIKNAQGHNPRKWETELQFFRHMRNGCFHNNVFNILPDGKGNDQIDPVNPPQWMDYIMATDDAMKKLQVIGGYFQVIHVLPFLHDMGYHVQ